ncbi:MAG: TRAP transporter large permease [Bradyrhizobium sp.]|uniref:TRAP transporter large permease n=1 Tax=Bradyrhizobium sp. TaxID=376 RepID=UPI003D1013A4
MSIEIFMLIFLGLLFVGVPMAFAMAGSSAIYFAFKDPSSFALIPDKIFEGLDNIILTAIPFFLLAGELMNRSGMAERLIVFSDLVIGRVRGGFAYVNVLASLLFSGLTGVAVGDIAALGKIEVNAMEKHGYPRPFAAAVTVASSLVGPIIPPSGVIILYCAIMNVSVGAMFLAALIPGVLMSIADMLVIAIQAKRRNFPIPQTKRTVSAFLQASKDAVLALLMPVFLIGGIVGGFMTPTEAAAVTVLYALFVGGVVYRAMSPVKLLRAFGTATYETARLMFMIGGALIMSWIFAIENVTGLVANMFAGVTTSPVVLIFLINLLFLVIGMFMESGIALILFAPVVGPIAYAAGVHPLQLGIMLIINVVVGLATPPVGNVLFALSSIVSVKMAELIRELIPFIAIKFVLMMIIGLVPALTTAIPKYFGY